jgi:hypothetical protein
MKNSLHNPCRPVMGTAVAVLPRRTSPGALRKPALPVARWRAVSSVMWLPLVMPLSGQAGTVDVQGSCVGSAVTVGRELRPGTTQQASDGADTTSTVMGCNAQGGSAGGTTAVGSYSLASALGGSAYGFNSLAAKWATASGLDAAAEGRRPIPWRLAGRAATVLCHSP